MVLDHSLKVIDLSGNGASSDDFYLAIVVDKNAVRVQIAHFGFNSFELVACPDHVVKQVPNFPLFKKPIYLQPILYFSLEHV